jgi:superfamily I DNA/RNA helicase
MPTSIFEELNPSQREAVETSEGRILVLAGAGSGKTRVIVYRTAYLIQELGVPPEGVVGLTFTNKAAREMKSRLAALLGPGLSRQVTFATFHSFALQFLRRHIGRLGYTKSFSIYDERDMDRLMKQAARECLDHSGELPPLGPIRNSVYQAFQQDPLHRDKLQFQNPLSKQIFFQLQQTLRAYNALNFDHLITLSAELLLSHPDILAQTRSQIRYLMIDEYQDTNPAQFRLAELLAANLCVVGDDDQAIYGWRGADVANILHFHADKMITLRENYRSTPQIVEAAGSVIAKNQKRYPKALMSMQPSGPLIQIFHAPDDEKEASAVVQKLLHIKTEHHLRWNDFAILYRSNSLSRQIEKALLQASYVEEGRWKRGIPYEVIGGLEFTERAEIKDVTAFLRVIANPLDQEALLRIINVPRRGVSDAFLDLLTQQARTTNQPLWNILQDISSREALFQRHLKGVAGITQLLEILETYKRQFDRGSFADTLQQFLSDIDYEKAILDDVKSETMRQFKRDNVQECVHALRAYEQTAPISEQSLAHFLSETLLGQASFISARHATSSITNQVQLITFHSAKGLEFTACFVIGLEDHILPHERAEGTTGIEEERRLFYVAMTRAKKWLTLSMAQSRMSLGKPRITQPSRFLFDIPKELLEVTSYL